MHKWSKYCLTVTLAGALSLTAVGAAGAFPHKVQRGDTLWSLSRRYGVTVSQIQTANRLPSSLIRIGEVLDIPTGNSPTPGNQIATLARGNLSHKVQPGDTLWLLSHRYGVTVSQLQAANGLSSSLIWVGQVLTVPAGGNPTAGDQAPAPSRGGHELSSTIGLRAVLIARRYEGVPYVWGGTSPSGFDCSGFTRYVYQKLGVNLPHLASAQASMGVHVDRDNLLPGDLVFFRTGGSGISHVGIYVGNSYFISAANHGVALASLDDPYYWGPRYAGARRIWV